MVRKAEPRWREYQYRWTYSRQVTNHGGHELDYSFSVETLESIEKVENALFLFDKKPVYNKEIEWKEMQMCWVLREYCVSCGSVAVIGSRDLKVINKVPNALFIFDKEEII